MGSKKKSQHKKKPQPQKPKPVSTDTPPEPQSFSVRPPDPDPSLPPASSLPDTPHGAPPASVQQLAATLADTSNRPPAVDLQQLAAALATTGSTAASESANKPGAASSAGRTGDADVPSHFQAPETKTWASGGYTDQYDINEELSQASDDDVPDDAKVLEYGESIGFRKEMMLLALERSFPDLEAPENPALVSREVYMRDQAKVLMDLKKSVDGLQNHSDALIDREEAATQIRTAIASEDKKIYNEMVHIQNVDDQIHLEAARIQRLLQSNPVAGYKRLLLALGRNQFELVRLEFLHDRLKTAHQEAKLERQDLVRVAVAEKAERQFYEQIAQTMYDKMTKMEENLRKAAVSMKQDDENQAADRKRLLVNEQKLESMLTHQVETGKVMISAAGLTTSAIRTIRREVNSVNQLFKKHQRATIQAMRMIHDKYDCALRAIDQERYDERSRAVQLLEDKLSSSVVLKQLDAERERVRVLEEELEKERARGKIRQSQQAFVLSDSTQTVSETNDDQKPTGPSSSSSDDDLQHDKFLSSIKQISAILLDEPTTDSGDYNLHGAVFKESFAKFLAQYSRNFSYFEDQLRAKELEVQVQQARARDYKAAMEDAENHTQDMIHRVGQLSDSLNDTVESLLSAKDLMRGAIEEYMKLSRQWANEGRESTEQMEQTKSALWSAYGALKGGPVKGSQARQVQDPQSPKNTTNTNGEHNGSTKAKGTLPSVPLSPAPVANGRADRTEKVERLEKLMPKTNGTKTELRPDHESRAERSPRTRNHSNGSSSGYDRSIAPGTESGRSRSHSRSSTASQSSASPIAAQGASATALPKSASASQPAALKKSAKSVSATAAPSQLPSGPASQVSSQSSDKAGSQPSPSQATPKAAAKAQSPSQPRPQAPSPPQQPQSQLGPQPLPRTRAEPAQVQKLGSGPLGIMGEAGHMNPDSILDYYSTLTTLRELLNLPESPSGELVMERQKEFRRLFAQDYRGKSVTQLVKLLHKETPCTNSSCQFHGQKSPLWSLVEKAHKLGHIGQ